MHLYLPVASVASFLVGIFVATTFCLCYVCASRKTKSISSKNQNFTLNTTKSDDVVLQNSSSASLRSPPTLYFNTAPNTAPSAFRYTVQSMPNSVLSASDPTPQSVSQCTAESMPRPTSVATYENMPAAKKSTEYVNVVPLKSNIAYVARKSSTGARH